MESNHVLLNYQFSVLPVNYAPLENNVLYQRCFLLAHLDIPYVITYNNYMTTVSATQARANLYDLIEEVSASGKPVGITNKGKTKAVLISAEELASWEATLDVISSSKLVKGIRKGMEDIKKGRVVPWEEVKKKAGL